MQKQRGKRAPMHLKPHPWVAHSVVEKSSHGHKQGQGGLGNWVLGNWVLGLAAAPPQELHSVEEGARVRLGSWPIPPALDKAWSIFIQTVWKGREDAKLSTETEHKDYYYMWEQNSKLRLFEVNANLFPVLPLQYWSNSSTALSLSSLSCNMRTKIAKMHWIHKICYIPLQEQYKCYFSLYLLQPYGAGAITIWAVQMGKLRHREVQ